MFLLTLVAAQAQAPLSINTAAETPVVYVTAQEGAKSKRFADDASTEHVVFAKGQPLRVLFREKGWVRVRDGDKYGWIRESQTSTEAPKIELPTLLQ